MLHVSETIQNVGCVTQHANGNADLRAQILRTL